MIRFQLDNMKKILNLYWTSPTRFLLVFLLLELLISICFGFVMYFIASTYPETYGDYSANVDRLEYPFYLLVLIIPFAALAEEILFRFFPFLIVFELCAKFDIRPKVPVLLVSIAASFLFGVLHGNILNVFVQGTAGLVYTYIFLTFSTDDPFMGTLEGNEILKLNRGLMASSVMHTLSNTTLIGIVYLLKNLV